MFIYDEEMKLINECDYIEDKLQAFTVYLNIHSVIEECLSASLGKEYIQGMMKGYLKVFIECLEKPITLSEFVKGLVRGIKYGKLINHDTVVDVLTLYEEDPNVILRLVPYVDEINSLNCDMYIKERFVIRVREILKKVFDNIDKYPLFINNPTNLKHRVIDSVTKNIKQVITASNSFKEFQRFMVDIITCEIYKFLKDSDLCSRFESLNTDEGFLELEDQYLLLFLVTALIVEDNLLKDIEYVSNFLGIEKSVLLTHSKKIDRFLYDYINSQLNDKSNGCKM